MADGSDEYGDVDRMVALARDGADVVAASRYMRGGRQVGGPRLKRLLSRAAGLSLHWFAGVPIHDPTNNFKLYSRRFLDATPIESEAGFELAIELSVKATLQGRRLAEVPTTWRDRTGGESRFRLRKWLPHYLRWYLVAFRGRLRRGPDSRRVTSRWRSVSTTNTVTARIATRPANPTGPAAGIGDPGSASGGIATSRFAVTATARTPQAARSRFRETSTTGTRKTTAA